MKIKTIMVCALTMTLLLAASASARRTTGRPLSISAPSPLCESMGIYDTEKCKNSPAIKRLGCDNIVPPPSYWGGLRPFVPMAICQKFRGKATDPAVRTTGCKRPVREQIIVLISKKRGYDVRIIEDRTAFKGFFVPIENETEALSFAAVLTGSYPVYDFPEKYFIRNIDEDGKYTVGNPKPTEVKEKGGGFEINLFEHPICGCNRPALFEVRYLVSRDGDIRELGRKKVWEANRRYNICID